MTVDDLMERAAAEWVTRRFGNYGNLSKELKKGYRIENVEFSTYAGGYCETCSYETVGVSFNTVQVGKNNQTYRNWHNEELYSASFVEIIREVSEIIDELRDSPSSTYK